MLLPQPLAYGFGLFNPGLVAKPKFGGSGGRGGAKPAPTGFITGRVFEKKAGGLSYPNRINYSLSHGRYFRKGSIWEGLGGERSPRQQDQLQL